MEVLSRLLENVQPAVVLVRGKAISEVVYGFGDASGGGFGTTWSGDRKNSQIHFRLGVWQERVKEISSNFRELTNLVESLEEKGSLGDLEGNEVLLCTNNSTCENVFYKGNSSSPLLF